MNRRVQSDAEITALLIAPDRGLAEKFLATVPETRAFQILADLTSYPSLQTVDVRVRQLRPAVILVDLATDLSAAVDLIRTISTRDLPVQIVGLHNQNDSQAILQSLRAGAVEFLYAPFEPAHQQEAIARLRRMITPAEPVRTEEGQVIAFTSSKPGSGASTLATQTAFSLQRLTGKRILLADCDLTGGTIGFYLKLTHNYSLVDALQHVEHLDSALWNSLVVRYGGVDILPAPAVPYASPLDPARLRALAEQAASIYDWVVLDLPTIFSQISLLAVAECTRAIIVTTTELPSLHLTRKAMGLVDQLGFPRDRFHVVVNRVDKRDDIARADMEQLFGCRVYAGLPNDYFALHRVVTLGQPLGSDSELGRAIEDVAQRLNRSLTGTPVDPSPLEAKPALSRV